MSRELTFHDLLTAMDTIRREQENGNLSRTRILMRDNDAEILDATQERVRRIRNDYYPEQPVTFDAVLIDDISMFRRLALAVSSARRYRPEQPITEGTEDATVF